MILNYNKYRKNILNENNPNNIIKDNIDIGVDNFNEIIDNAYKHFKKIKKPVNTLDIIEYIENKIGKELPDDDYSKLYYKLTGEYIDDDEISDIGSEERYIIK